MSNADMNDWNTKIIAEFRENGGVVGGPFEGAPMVLVHHTGAKSGTERVTPLMYRAGDAGTIHILASKAGAPDNPDWFHNLRANPDTTIEIGSEVGVAVRATVLEGAERDEVWEAQKQEYPQLAEYERATDRTIPVVALTRT